MTGAARYSTGSPPNLPEIKGATRGSVVDVSHRLGTPLQECPQWLIAAPKDQLPQPERLAFTPPARGEGMSCCPSIIHLTHSCLSDGQFIIPRPIPPPPSERKDAEENPQNQNRNIWGINNNVASKKRTYEHTNGAVDGNQLKYTRLLTSPNVLISQPVACLRPVSRRDDSWLRLDS